MRRQGVVMREEWGHERRERGVVRETEKDGAATGIVREDGAMR